MGQLIVVRLKRHLANPQVAEFFFPVNAAGGTVLFTASGGDE